MYQSLVNLNISANEKLLEEKSGSDVQRQLDAFCNTIQRKFGKRPTKYTSQILKGGLTVSEAANPPTILGVLSLS